MSRTVVQHAPYINKHTPSYEYMYTPEFHSYHTAVILLSDLDFVALNTEHIFLRWRQALAKIVGAMEVSY